MVLKVHLVVMGKNKRKIFIDCFFLFVCFFRLKQCCIWRTLPLFCLQTVRQLVYSVMEEKIFLSLYYYLIDIVNIQILSFLLQNYIMPL